MRSLLNPGTNISITRWTMNNFDQEVRGRIESNATNEPLKRDAKAHLLSTIAAQYSYNFSWLSRPIIQYPQDIVAIQELIWKTKPDLIILSLIHISEPTRRTPI